MYEHLTRIPLVRRALALASQSLYSNAFYLMLAQVLISAFGFVFWVVVARFYTETEVGYSSAILSALGLVALIGQIGMDTFIVRFLSKAGGPIHLLNTCLTWGGTATFVVAMVAAIGFKLWSPSIGFVGSQPIFLAAFVCFAVISTLSAFYGAAFVANRKSLYLLLKDAMFGGVKLVLPLLFVHYFRSFGIVASWGLGVAAALALSVWVLMPRVIAGYKPRPALSSRLVRRAWGFSSLSYVTTLVSALPKYLMPVMVINLLGPEENAYFYVAWAMAMVITFIPAAIAQSLLAEAAYDKRSLRHNVKQAFQLSLSLIVPAALLMLVLGDTFLLAFGGSYSERSVALLQVLLFTGIPITVERIYFSVLRVTGRVREILAWRVCLTIAILVGSYYYIQVSGLEAIGWVYLIAHSVVAVLLLTTRYRNWRIP